MTSAVHRTMAELHEGLPEVRTSPRDLGVLRMIVRRPADGEREMLDAADLDLNVGLVGDNWHTRPSSRTPDRSPHPDMQLNIMNVRAADLIAGSEDRWSLAGDQLFVDMDLSYANLPPGTRLSIGDAVVEVTDQPHRGCRKFHDRFGNDALRFVNSPEGQELNLRGICARVVTPGQIARGDLVRRL